MQIELWGATALPRISLPERPAGYLLLAVYAALLVAALFYYRRVVWRMSARQWALTVAFALLSLATRQFLETTYVLGGQVATLDAARNPAAVVAPLALVPLLGAAAILGPPAAMIVGFVDGLGRAMWQSHQLFDPFHLALAGCLAAILIRQNFPGGLYAALRRPIFTAPFVAALLVLFTGLAAYSYAAQQAGELAALELALSTSYSYIPGLLGEALVAGTLVWLIVSNLPRPLPGEPYSPAPLSRSLNRRLLVTFLTFAVLLTAILIVVGFNLAMGVVTRQALTQMSQDAAVVSERLPTFLSRRQALLVQAAGEESLLSNDRSAVNEMLRRIHRWGGLYRRVFLVDMSLRTRAIYPNNELSVDLTALERDAVARAVRTGQPFIGPAQAAEDVAYLISFIVPVSDDSGQLRGALIGQVPEAALDELLVGLQGTMDEGYGFIVDDYHQVVAHPDRANLLKSWSPSVDQPPREVASLGLAGVSYLGYEASTTGRELVHYQVASDFPWTVVVRLPYEAVVGQAMQIVGQIALNLALAVVLLGAYLFALGRSVARPLNELADVSLEFAGGNLSATIKAEGEDEIGRLGYSFRQMQAALRFRLDELSLLLNVSQNVSRTMDLNRSMPAILRGAMRGTGAAGARIVIYSPTGRQPLVYGEGPASNTMARYDRQLTTLVREGGELALPDPRAVGETLAPGRGTDRVPTALAAVPLVAHERVQGVFWITHRRAHDFGQSELDFLRTLAGQASVLVENARLYAAAEGGRRRLTAVLASTSNAVVVTDQTDRILLINPAMENLLGVDENEVIGLKVRSVIGDQALAAVLTDGVESVGNLELTSKDGKVFYGGASTVFNHEGKAIGRVAVFKDISYLKEIDRMKSEFVATVSHDLRSPLTYMMGYATTLPMAGSLEPKQREYVDKILVGIDQMTRLIDALLDLGRLEAGIDLVMSEFRVPEIIYSVADELRQPAEENGCQIDVDLRETLPAVRGDIALIRQAVLNVVGNAVKYAPGSGPITLTATRQNSEVIIGVADQGPGLSEEDQVLVFDKFYRANREKSNELGIRGSGLGLALVRSIAERHGGRAWCSSELGSGSTFYIALPLSGS
jgi:PAS domain S-box-containing protein